MGSLLHTAHARDYEKRKPRPQGDVDAGSSDEEDDREDETDHLKSTVDLEEDLRGEREVEEADELVRRGRTDDAELDDVGESSGSRES